MAFTIHETVEIKRFAQRYINAFKYVIETNKINHAGKLKTITAPVNASGRLANSGEYRYENGALEILVNNYIYFLLFGRKPQSDIVKSRPPITEIEAWMAEKGIVGVSPFAIANSIAARGSSIYNAYNGSNSGLLEKIDLDQYLTDLSLSLGDLSANEITTDILKIFEE